MKKLKLFLCLVLLTCFHAFAQNPTGPIIPKVIPPSPEAQTFMRYGEIPVDPSTGVPNIEIPLYTIISGKLKLPVSITYHSSGIRVNDIAGVAGLGWRLLAGGVLTKTVIGQPDNSPSYGMFNYPYLNKSQIDALPQDGSHFFDLKYLSEGSRDNESDKYFYSCGDKLSGEFIYDHSFNIVPTTYTNNKIIPLNPASDGSGPTAYKVVDEDGTQYYFQNLEYSKINIDPQYISSWWLTKIVSADNTDVINFEYQQYNSPNVVYSQSQSITAFYPNQPSPNVNYSGSQTNTFPLLLKKITFTNGYVTFDYINDRKDLQDNRLSKVSVFSSGANNLLKQYRFSHSYFGSGAGENKYNYRLKLDGVAVYDDASQNIQNYTFEYDQTYSMPPYTQDTYYNNPFCYAQDYSGYFNGVYTNSHLITGYLPFPNVAANRTPNYDYAKTCVLTKINYPTGGSSTFEYQLNDGPPTASQYQAGLRIHRITNRTNNNSIANVKRYDYGANLLRLDLDRTGSTQYEWLAYLNPDISNCNAVYWNFTTYLSSPVVPFQNFHGSNALYETVDEYDDDPINNVNLKKTYGYSSDGDISISVTSAKYLNQYYVDCSWNKGQLRSTAYYKYNSLGYVPVRSILTNYSDYKVTTVSPGTKVERIRPVVGSGCILDQGMVPGSTYQQYFTYFDIPIQIGIKKPTSVSTIEFDDNGNQTTTTETTLYNSQYHLFPTSKIQTASNGDIKKTDFSYAYDFIGTSVYDQMINKNQISPVIEQKFYKTTNGSTSFLQSSKNNYNFWGVNSWSSNPTDAIYPQTIEAQKAGFNPELRIQYYAYDDQGNTKSVGKVDGPKINYIWGYGGSYPIAQVTNADYSTIESLLGGATAIQNFKNTLLPSDAAVNAFLSPLRTLANAQMTIYTYSPLQGITSTTDAKGITTYYEYDSFNRLRFIKDNDRHIVKAYCYNYQGQQTDCFVPSLNANIYARVEIDNITYGYYYGGNYSTGDVYIRLYSDPQCQHPVTLSTSMTMSVTVSEDDYGDYTYSNSNNNDYSVPQGVSSFYIGNQYLYINSSYNDGYNFHSTYMNYSYSMAAHIGSNYTPIP